MELVAELFEAVMILCFGLSWPISIRKSYLSRTAKGKSLFFEVFIWAGYIFGISRKIIQICIDKVPADSVAAFLFYLAGAFYILNFVEITIDMLLYFRNTKLDAERDAAAAKAEA
jgi:hypothetical protein